jgi:AcrR family transcriptional regulator
VLYQHFATKSDLYAALIEQLANRDTHDALPAIGEDHTATDEREFMTHLADVMIDWHLQHPAYVRLLIQSGLENHEFSRLFYERYSKSFIDHLTRYFSHAIGRGALRPKDPRLLAHTFISMVANYALQLTVFHDCCEQMPRRQMVDGFIDIFLEGAKQREPQS